MQYTLLLFNLIYRKTIYLPEQILNKFRQETSAHVIGKIPFHLGGTVKNCHLTNLVDLKSLYK